MRKYKQALAAITVATLSALTANTSQATQCDVTFELAGAQAPIGLLGISVDYSAVSGTFAGVGNGVHCRPLVDETSIIARDNCLAPDSYCYSGAGRNLALVLQNPFGLVDGAVASCTLEATIDKLPGPDSFSIQLESASFLGSSEDDVSAAIRVSAVQCTN
jgi:hypothetical protein